MKESDIRPADIMKEFIGLCARDAETYFVGIPREKIPCPACDSRAAQPAFVKSTFSFVVCEECGTLYQSPRPVKEAFDRFYQESPSNQYLFKTFYPAVIESRLESLFRPRVQEVARLLAEDNLRPSSVGEVGAGHGLFLEEWQRAFPGADMIAIEPNREMADICRGKGFSALESFAEEIGEGHSPIDLLVAFEVIEHSYDPFAFCCSLKRLLARQGRLLLTGLTVDGFDIQVLWDKAQIVAPAQHLNFMSVRGFEILLQRAGFSEVTVTTPGKLDVEIVRNAVQDGFDLPPALRFIKTLLSRNKDAQADFQAFLSRHNLSSHCWVWAKTT